MADSANKNTTKAKNQFFAEKEEALKNMGGEKQIQKQHDSNKLTARERLAILFDEGYFSGITTFRSTSLQPLRPR